MSKIRMNAEVDLGELADDVIEEEAGKRGLIKEVSSFDTEELEEELLCRREGTNLDGLFANPKWSAWLAAQNPPQEIRDAYFQSQGKMLL